MFTAGQPAQLAVGDDLADNVLLAVALSQLQLLWRLHGLEYLQMQNYHALASTTQVSYE